MVTRNMISRKLFNEVNSRITEGRVQRANKLIMQSQKTNNSK